MRVSRSSRPGADSVASGALIVGETLREHMDKALAGALGTTDSGARAASVVALQPSEVFVLDPDVWLSAFAIRLMIERGRERGTPCVAIVTDASGREEATPGAAYFPGGVASRLLPGGSGPAPALTSILPDVSQRLEYDGVTLDPGAPPCRMVTRFDVATIETRILRDRARSAVLGGARLRDLQHIHLRGEIRWGRNVELDVGVIVDGRVTLGDDVYVGPYSMLRDVTIGDRSRVKAYSIIEESSVGADCFVGPYARLRPGTTIGAGTQVGNFVEIKQSQIGASCRINHHSFIGDAELGTNVTIGAGTITCNHDGLASARTVIHDGAYVGAGTQLVAPVTVGVGATIGAGSTITSDVPANQLTVARARQVTIEGWTRR